MSGREMPDEGDGGGERGRDPKDESMAGNALTKGGVVIGANDGDDDELAGGCGYRIQSEVQLAVEERGHFGMGYGRKQRRGLAQARILFALLLHLTQLPADENEVRQINVERGAARRRDKQQRR